LGTAKELQAPPSPPPAGVGGWETAAPWELFAPSPPRTPGPPGPGYGHLGATSGGGITKEPALKKKDAPLH
jgi:hypothetical protein